MSEKLQSYIELIRLKKPIGFLLLFWPCIWGLTIVYDFQKGLFDFLYLTFLFLTGSILMRSAGCIINDIVDREYDKKVDRTKLRPIASGKIKVIEASILSMILCSIAFLVLLQFNNLTILLALFSMPLAFTYPYMKRFTYWPQLYLGVTFNYGLLLGWTSIADSLSLLPIIFYIGAIFWTLGYDTIYGYQDINDDEIIGVKSTSIKFKKSPKIFLILCYLITLICLIYVGFSMSFSLIYFIFLAVPAYNLFFHQIYKLNIKDSANCLKLFKSNNFLGMFVFFNLLIGKFF